jgi:photosystem II stability/assembly factor-like uncharacterized protein
MRVTRLASLALAAAFLLLVAAPPARALDGAADSNDTSGANDAFDPSLAKLLHWRCVGPFRGGRVAAVAGHPDQPLTYYMGATGGGVWKTSDGGQRWRCVSDGFFGGSIGAVAVAPSDPNVVYVGGGEVTVRGNWSPGFGAWRSTDAGKSWTSMGFGDAQCIPRIRVDPKNADVLYAAVLGHLFGPNETRGVYKSTDGGRTWKRTLFVDENVGACDLLIDPNNSRVLYATTWRVRRTPWTLESGGPGSGVWKSVDGGETWSDWTHKPGLPGGMIGICSVAISPADSDRVWLQVEAGDGGLFRSDDGGEHFGKVSGDHEITQRAWYFSRIVADPKNVDVVYALNVQFLRSRDGGHTFHGVNIPHGDNHDLWIDPNDANRMVEGNDGGACVSFDGAQNWSTLENQPTAQIYRVAIDDHFPWRVYGAQQDNSALRLYPLGGSFALGGENWEVTAGGESGWIAPDPRNPEVVYGGNYGGSLQRLDHVNRQSRNVMVWPDNPMGAGADALKYRFQWNYPLLFSRHDPRRLYAAANVLFATTDEGRSWSAISPDLTRNDHTKMAASGGPITKDNTSVEYYGTIFAVAESALERDVVWCGSDDGLVQLTRDGGQHWSDVTPRHVPEWIQVNSIEANPFEPGGCYVAATMYKSDDFKPYLYRTSDFGKSWTLITNGIPDGHFTRVVRADPKRRGLLFAGTEAGVHVSFDDGDHWRPLQLELPTVPITDLAIKDDTLVAATQGRSFWIFDELNLLRQVETEGKGRELDAVTLFAPRTVDALRGNATVDFFLKEKPADATRVALAVVDPSGKVVRSFARPKGDDDEEFGVEAGFNRFQWNRRWTDAKGFDGLVMWGGTLTGPDALPGTYTVKLTVGEQTRSAPLELRADPRSDVTAAAAQERFDFALSLRDLVSRTHESIAQIRDLRGQLNQLAARLEKSDKDAKAEKKEAAAAAPGRFDELVKSCRSIVEKLTAVEETLYQTKLASGEDALNYPIRLNDKLAFLYALVRGSNSVLTEQCKQLRAELVPQVEAQLEKFDAVVEKELPALDRLALEKQVPAIFVAPRESHGAIGVAAPSSEEEEEERERGEIREGGRD